MAASINKVGARRNIYVGRQEKVVTNQREAEMRRILTGLCMLSIIPLIVGGCAGTMENYQKSNVAKELKPLGIYEDCMDMVSGQVLNYSFKASAPLSFNIHYHEGDDVVYPVSKEKAISDSGSMLCEKREKYCLMWTNTHGDPATVTYSYHVEVKK